MVAGGLHPLTALERVRSRAGAGQVPYRRPQLVRADRRSRTPGETGRGTPLDALMPDITLRAVGGGLPHPPTGCPTASVGYGAKPHGFASINLIQGNKVLDAHKQGLSGQLRYLWKYHPRGTKTLDLFHWIAFFRASIQLLRGRNA